LTSIIGRVWGRVSSPQYLGEATTKKAEELAKAQQHIDLAVDSREARRDYREKNPIDYSKVLAQMNSMAGPIRIDLRELGEVDDEAAFAWILSEVGEKTYIGKHLILDENYEVVVASWRAGTSAAYYLSNIKAKQGLIAKSRLIHEIPNKLLDIDLTIFNDLEEKVSKLELGANFDLSTGISDSVLHELDANSSGNLKEIIRTIHASQYEIISAERKGLHIVQGAPGTGKTVVGVHRASWLLYPGNDVSLKPEKTLIVGPNDTFIRYISGLLPTLGESRIKHRSINNINAKFKSHFADSPNIARIKGDLRMTTVLKKSIYDRIRIPEKSISFSLAPHIKPIEIQNFEISERIKDWFSSNVSYNSGKSSFRRFLITLINEKISSSKDFKSNFEKFATESSVDSIVNQIWPNLSAVPILRSLFTNHARLLSAAADTTFTIGEISQLVRKSEGPTKELLWTNEDIPLLDCLDFLIDGNREKFDLLIVDEAQDLTPMQLDVIGRLSSSGDILVLGDLAQATGVWEHTNWTDISECLGFPIARMDELLYGYRVPVQVYSYASNVLSHIDLNQKPPILIRNVAEQPTLEIFDALERLLQGLTNQLRTLNLSDGVVGIISTESILEVIEKHLVELGINFTKVSQLGLKPGLNLISIADQKGLECDHVFIVDPQSIIDNSKSGLKQLYVSVTRSLKALTIYAIQKMPLELITHAELPVSNEIKSNEPDSSLSNEEILILEEVKDYLKFRDITPGQLERVIRKGFSQ
jgi:DNA helicase IV